MSWSYEPVRTPGGLVDVTKSLIEFERLAWREAKRVRFLWLMPRARRRLVNEQVAFARASWLADNERNGL